MDKTVIIAIIGVIGTLGSAYLAAYFGSKKGKQEIEAAAAAKKKEDDAAFIRDNFFTAEKYEAFRNKITEEVRADAAAEIQPRIDSAVKIAIDNERKNTQFELLDLRAEIKALRHYIINIGAADGMTEEVSRLKVEFMKEMQNGNQ